MKRLNQNLRTEQKQGEIAESLKTAEIFDLTEMIFRENEYRKAEISKPLRNPIF
jgi:hypothetical protein